MSINLQPSSTNAEGVLGKFIYVLTRRIATYHAHDNEKPANKNSSEIRSGSSYLRNKQTFLRNSNNNRPDVYRILIGEISRKSF